MRLSSWLSNDNSFILQTIMEWQKLSCAIPEFTMGTITQYFIARISSYDNKPTNDVKNISKHAYPLFRAGNIQKIEIMADSTHYHYRCVCLPEMKKDIQYKICLSVAKATADISSASCQCPAGKGPHGSCKHIAALAYALEDYSRLKLYETSCTSVLQRWNQPRKRHLDPVCVSEIDFSNLEHGKVKRKLADMLYDPRPARLQQTLESDIEQLKTSLFNHHSSNPPALLQVLSSTVTAEGITPSTLRETLVSRLKQMQPSLSDIKATGDEFVEALKVDASSVEVATRLQSKSVRWHDERKYRVTASNFGVVCKRRAPNPPLVRRLLYATTIDMTTAALEWGRSHEEEARMEYEKTLESGYKVEACGLFVYENGFLAATPDGIVVDDHSNKDRLLEIKCPYSFRDDTVLSACSSSKFFCTLEDNRPRLKKTHNYFYQIQGQMAIAGIHRCDFIVWTSKDLSVETVTFDPIFWSTKCLPRLETFYMKCMLPEIVHPKYPQDPLDYSTLF